VGVGAMSAAEGGQRSPRAELDTSSAIGGAGGVKALLNKLNTKYTESHVTLPDGTTVQATQSGRKFSTPKRQPKADQEATGGNADGSAAPASAGASGVKARLAEINSKYTNSHVKLPDGSVLAPPKRGPAGDAKGDAKADGGGQGSAQPHVGGQPASDPGLAAHAAHNQTQLYGGNVTPVRIEERLKDTSPVIAGLQQGEGGAPPGDAPAEVTPSAISAPRTPPPAALSHAPR
jgi:hypothetical protein